MKLSPFAAMLLYCISFAVFFTLQQKLLNTGMSPVYLNALSYLFAGIFLCVYLLLKNKEAFVIKSKKGVMYGIGIALSCSVFADVLVLYGLKVGTPITWSLLLCSAPLLTYLLAIPILKESLTTKKLLAVFISIVGAILVIYVPKMGIDLQHGAPYFIGAILFFGIGNILTQFVFQYITPIQLTLIKLVTASAVLLLMWPIMHIEMVPINWVVLIANSFVLLAANILVNYIINKASATYFAIGTNMSPLFVTLVSVLFVSVWPTYMQLIGGVVIVGGIFLFQFAAKKVSTPQQVDYQTPSK